MELQCSVCDITKGMDDFAKSQRSKGDAAVRTRLLKAGFGLLTVA